MASLAGHVVRITLGGKSKLITTPALKRKHPRLYQLWRQSGIDNRGGLGKSVKVKQRAKHGGRVIAFENVHPRDMSRELRLKIVGNGLTPGGKAWTAFVEEGMTFQEWCDNGREAAALATADVIAEHYRKHPELVKQKERQRERRKESKQQEEHTERIDYSQYASPADIAEQVGCAPLEVRKFLRAKGIGKRGGRYAFTEPEVAKVVKALRRYLEEE